MNKSIFQIKSVLLIQVCILKLCIFSTAYANEELKNLDLISIGKIDAPVEIRVYSSLTCPHCANFHINVIPKIEEKYVATGKAKIFFVDFPLDLAALNASKILHCVEKNKQMILMDLIYKKQNQWIKGSTIEEINNNLKEIVTTSGINSDKIDECFANENIENKVLNARIEGQKKYSISSTPTIIINDKKLEGAHDFENIKKIIENII